MERSVQSTSVLQQHPVATEDVQELWLDKERAKAQRSIHVTCPAEYFPLEGRFQSLLG